MEQNVPHVHIRFRVIIIVLLHLIIDIYEFDCGVSECHSLPECYLELGLFFGGEFSPQKYPQIIGRFIFSVECLVEKHNILN
jgi:hypothetical protein